MYRTSQNVGGKSPMSIGNEGSGDGSVGNHRPVCDRLPKKGGRGRFSSE